MAKHPTRTPRKARSTIDARRLASLVSQPGIDPRSWIRFAVVLDVAYQKEAGMFVDVRLLPDGQQVSAVVGSPYAGALFGLWGPLHVDDVVVVGIPDGDTSHGAVVLSRCWRESDIPPTDLSAGTNVDDNGSADATNNVVLRVEKGQKLIIRTSGDTGNVDIQVEGNGELHLEAKGSGPIRIKQSGTGNIFIHADDAAAKVFLGGETGTQPDCLGQTAQTNFVSLQSYLDSHVHTPGTFSNGGGPVVGTSGPPNASPAPTDVRATKVETK